MLPPWLEPPPRSRPFLFSTPINTVAGVEQLIGRVRTAPGLWRRLALYSLGTTAASPNHRLRMEGPGVAEFFNVPHPFGASQPIGIPFFALVPPDQETAIFFTCNGTVNNLVFRLMGWDFDPGVRPR